MERMTRLSSNMEKMVNSIADEFSLLKNTLYSAPNGMYSPPGAYYYYYYYFELYSNATWKVVMKWR